MFTLGYFSINLWSHAYHNMGTYKEGQPHLVYNVESTCNAVQWLHIKSFGHCINNDIKLGATGFRGRTSCD